MEARIILGAVRKKVTNFINPPSEFEGINDPEIKVIPFDVVATPSAGPDVNLDDIKILEGQQGHVEEPVLDTKINIRDSILNAPAEWKTVVSITRPEDVVYATVSSNRNADKSTHFLNFMVMDVDGNILDSFTFNTPYSTGNTLSSLLNHALPTIGRSEIPVWKETTQIASDDQNAFWDKLRRANLPKIEPEAPIA